MSAFKNILVVVALPVFMLGGCGPKKEGNDAEKHQGMDTTKKELPKKNPGITDGPYTENYPNGQLKIQGEFKNGTRFGHWKAFYENGTVQSECYYEDGKLNGKSATFYKNGRVRYIGYYKWNEPSGTWEFYDTTGTLATKKEYK